MREKIAIAKKLRNSRNTFSSNENHRKLCSKCYRTYVVECIIKRKDEFKISFNGRYIQDFHKRIFDWYNYLLDVIYRFLLIHFAPKNDKSFKNYELIHYGVSKPIHLKVANVPDELVLEVFLKENGFEITDEHLYSNYTVYDVVRS